MSTPNPDDFATGREAEADANLLVKFFIKQREDKDATQSEGRPIFKDTEYIEIRVPGKRDAQACRPATGRDKARFPRHYDAFKSRTEMPEEGTPLFEWPQISRSMVETLSFMQIKTVEQLVNAADNNLSAIHGGIALKQRAQEFLKYADQTKLIAEKEALTAQLASQDEQLKSQAAQLADMQAAITKLTMAGVSPPAEVNVPEAKPKRRNRTQKPPAELEAAATPEV
jgi:hypothetical protein